MTPSPGIEPGTHWWKASALTTAPTLLLPTRVYVENGLEKNSLSCIFGGFNRKQVGHYSLRVCDLYGDLSRLLRLIFVTCISFPISTRNSEETFAGTFCCFHARLFGIKNARVFSKCFPSNISFWILKLFVFPAVAHFWAKNWLKKSQAKS